MLELLSRARAKVAPTIWQRRGVAVWNLDGELRSSVAWLADHLPALGFEVVYVKVQDGSKPYAGSANANLDPAKWDRLRRAGLKVAGWGYVYGYEPEKEVETAVSLCRAYDLAAFVADAEKEFEYDPANEPTAGAGGDRYARSAVWARAWRASGCRTPLGLTSFGRVDLHRLDWFAWRRVGARFLPQAYTNESFDLAPAKCVEAASIYWDRRFVHPWIGVYPVDHPQAPVESYPAELAAARTRGFAAYVADSMAVDDYMALKNAH